MIILKIIADKPFPKEWFSSGLSAVKTICVKTNNVHIAEKFIYANALVIGLFIFLTFTNSLTLIPNSKKVNAAIPIAIYEWNVVVFPENNSIELYIP